MPSVASIIVSSQLPLLVALPLTTSGRYTSRSIVANRVALGQLE